MDIGALLKGVGCARSHGHDGVVPEVGEDRGRRPFGCSFVETLIRNLLRISRICIACSQAGQTFRWQNFICGQAKVLFEFSQF